MKINDVEEMTIADFFNMCEKEDGKYQIDTPEGWQDINFLVKKKNRECYNLITKNGLELGCSSNHKILTNDGWKKVQNINVQNDFVITKNGEEEIIAKEFIGIKNTFDLQVNSNENRYYSNNIISHNCGKSLVCKAIAGTWGMPLLRLDFGRLFDSLVGQSEARVRSALRLAEAIAPCIDGNSIVYDSTGKPWAIKDILNFDEENLYTYSFNEKTLKTEKTKIQAVIRQPIKKEILCLKTWIGEINVTYDHKLMIIKNGIFEWTEARNVKKNDFLLCPKKLKREIDFLQWEDCVDKNTRLFSGNIWDKYKDTILPSERKKRKKSNSYYIKVKEINNIKNIDMPDKISIGRGGTASSTCQLKSLDLKQLYYLLGLVESDGYIAKKQNTIGFVNTEKSLHLEFRRIMINLFNIESKFYQNKNKHKNDMLPGLSDEPIFKKVYISSVTNKIIKIILKKSSEKLFNQEDQVIMSYLSGYFDGDGCITFDEKQQPRLIFCSKKQKSYEKIKRCLHILGILTSGNQKGFDVVISSFKDVESVANMLNLKHPDKFDKINFNMRLSKFSSSAHRERGYKIGKLLRECRIKNGLKTTDFSMSSSLISMYERKDQLLTEDKAEMINYVLSSRIGDENEICKIFNSDVIGVRVKEIQKKEKDWVYDLSIDKNYNFFVNNLLCKNCLLWIDEIEKGLSGVSSSGRTDGGTTSRVLSTFLTWMQEKKEAVFVVATANDHQAIPSEFLRAGRFDEIFFVDLPNAVERKDIFSVLLKKKGLKLENFNLDFLADKSNSEFYSGAELEKAIDNAMLMGFEDKRRKINSDDILVSLKSFRSLYQIRNETFLELQEWADSTQCLRANKQEKSKVNLGLTTEKTVDLD